MKSGEIYTLSDSDSKITLEQLHLVSNCHGETLANGQLFIPNSKDLNAIFADPKEFALDNSKTNIVVFSDEKNNITHSAKYNKRTKKYHFDDGEAKPNTGTLKDAAGEKDIIKGHPVFGQEEKYVNRKGLKEVDKKIKQTNGKIQNGIRIMDNEKDIKKD